MSVHTSESWKSLTYSPRLKRNVSIMYRMLKKIADEKEAWCVEEVRAVLRMTSNSAYIPSKLPYA